MTKSIGILGGGQLGQMLIESSKHYDVSCHTYDPDSSSSASKLSTTHTVGSFQNKDEIVQFGETKASVTAELEFISVPALEILESKGVSVYPQSKIMHIIQDKGRQKEFLYKHHIPTAPFFLTQFKPHVSDLPCVQKLRTSGYDGKGVVVLQTEADLDNAFDEPSVIEEKAAIKKEISVIVARDPKGHVVVYDPVEMVVNPKANLLDTLIYPARISDKENEIAKAIAWDVIVKLEMVGVLAVELFLCDSGEIWVNELAPRPHNSGHHTIEASKTSQYEQLIRILAGKSLGSTALLSPAVMINILGEPGYEGLAKVEGLEDVSSLPGVHVHMYGKLKTKPFRKMGHITILCSNIEDGLILAKEISKKVRVTT
jgi:5-(carboxyamino)imidazole ribonucleotide synthase